MPCPAPAGVKQAIETLFLPSFLLLLPPPQTSF
jgi:hypothetical protein